jgi:outer membrane protein TolC
VFRTSLLLVAVATCAPIGCVSGPSLGERSTDAVTIPAGADLPAIEDQIARSPLPSGVESSRQDLDVSASRPSSDQVIPAGFTAESKPRRNKADIEVVSQKSEERQPAELAIGDGHSVKPSSLPLNEVIESVYASYPLLEASMRERDVADGERVAAAGEFDLKLKATSENQPAGFYQTYRQSVGFVQPLYNGGEVFTGYRIGRGSFEPWYLGRQTNGGGEFKAGAAIPLSRNRQIDERRARLWSSTWDRKIVEPDIQGQLIGFVRDASYTYWEWIAAGRRFRIAESLLDYARDRDAAIRRKVEEGDTEEPVLKDNRRLIVSREAKLIDVRRKLQQSAIKLSLYYRAADGSPVIPMPEQLPDFPDEPPVEPEQLDADIDEALRRRPELRILDLTRRQLEVDYAQAHNEFRPSVDGFVAGSKDVGAQTSYLGYKTPLEVEAGVLVDVPLQRRKARGKMSAVDAKMMQLAAKRRITSDKITIEVQSAYAAMVAALERVTRARESVVLAAQLASIERRKQELGEVDLLSVNLRELQAAEAADVEVDALVDYFLARSDYRAALATDQLPGVTQ